MCKHCHLLLPWSTVLFCYTADKSNMAARTFLGVPMHIPAHLFILRAWSHKYWPTNGGKLKKQSTKALQHLFKSAEHMENNNTGSQVQTAGTFTNSTAGFIFIRYGIQSSPIMAGPLIHPSLPWFSYTGVQSPGPIYRTLPATPCQLLLCRISCMHVYTFSNCHITGNPCVSSSSFSARPVYHSSKRDSYRNGSG